MPQPSRPSTSGSARRAAVMVALGAVAVGTLLSGQSASMGSASAAEAPVPVVSTMDDPGTGRVAPASAVVTPTGPGSQVGDPRGAATDERSSAAPAGASSVPPDALHDPAHADDGHDDPVPRPVADAPQAAEPHPGEVPDVVVGTVVRAYAEVGHVHEQGSDAGLEAAGAGDEPGLFTWVQTDDDLTVRVPTEPLRDVPDGARVRVALGDRVEVRKVRDDPQGDEAIGYEVQAAEVIDSPGVEEERVMAAGPAPRDVLVVRVVPAGQSPDGTPVGTVVNAVNQGVSAFWSQQTGGAVTFAATGHADWVHTTATCSEAFTMWKEVAAKVGWTAGPRKHLLLYMARTQGVPNCYSGLGTVGSLDSGGRAYVQSTSTSLVAHELGHNLGLGHSDGLLCPGTSDGAYGDGWSGGCTTHGYRDYYDVMGISWSSLGSLSPVHGTALGAIANDSRLDVTAPVVADLAPISGASGLRTLVLDDGPTRYWVEFRPPSGRDAWLSANHYGLIGGVVVRRSDPGDPRGSLVLDGSPSASVNTGDWELPVAAGNVLRVASGRFAVRVEEVGASAKVAVAVDGVWPPAPPPVVWDDSPPAGYVPVTPFRAMSHTTVLGGSMHTMTLRDVPEGATAVTLNVTADSPSTGTFVSVCPGGTPLADCRRTSAFNPPARTNVSNLVTARLGPDNTVSVYNDKGWVQLLADVQGWFVPGDGTATYQGATPKRVMGSTAVDAGRMTTLTLQGVPAGATAVALNVTAASPSATTYVSVCPGGTDVGTCRASSNINPSAWVDKAGLVMVKLGPGNTVSLYNDKGTAHLLADLQGWFLTPSGSGSRYTAAAPTRALHQTPVPGGTALTLRFPDAPPGATAVVLNVTVASPNRHTYASVCPGGTPLDACRASSNVNTRAWTDTANLVVATLGPDGAVQLYNDQGTAGLLADVQGWFTAS